MDGPGGSDRGSDRAAGEGADYANPGNELEADAPREAPEAELVEDQGNAESLEIREELHALLQTSGPIPGAADLYEYREDHQERILRMAESSRTDESVRRDRVVEAQITVSRRGQVIQAAMLLGCIAATAVSLWVFNSPWGTAFLGLPVMQAIRSFKK